MENKEKFKNIEDYIIYWDDFFKEWNKGESHQEELLKSDNIWGNHRGEVRTVKKTGKLKSTKLEFNVLPQPYLGDINSHSVITLNLNPSRSKKGEKIHVLKNLEKGNENDVFEEEHLPNFKKAKNYYQYVNGFPTYDIGFWKDQKIWIDRIFEILDEEKPSDKKNGVEIKPFAIEICPWGSKSWLDLDIKKETKDLKKLDIPIKLFLKYLDDYVFDVIEKVIQKNLFPSKQKIVLSIGKAYYDIFNCNSDFEKLSEFTKSSKTNNEVVAQTNPHDENFILKIKKNWPLNKKEVLTNRSFSFWKRNDILYYNVFSPDGGKNNPPGRDFIEIEKEFFRIYKLLNKTKMAKDYTKYNVEGVGSNLNKARLVQKIVEHHASSFEGTYQAFLEIWFDDLQGGKGVCKALNDIDAKNERNYYIKEPITLSDGTKIAVCNQWGKENLSNFLLHAGTLGYQISTEGDQAAIAENEEVVAENAPKDDIIEGSPNWKLPHALAFVIRHTMLADGEVIEGELNWMQVAFDEYDEQGIEVRDVWDHVDTMSQMYSKMGRHNTLLVNAINYLGTHLDNAQKSRFIQILMQICAQDDLIAKNEYVTLLLVANNIYDGAAYPIRQVLDNAGLTIEEA